MSTNHTPEPWRMDMRIRTQTCEGDAGRAFPTFTTAGCIGGTEGHANAARIVACVNACAGITDPASTLAEAAEAIRKIMRHFKPEDGGCSLGADLSLCRRVLAQLGKG